MSLKLGNLSVVLETDNQPLKKGMADGREEVRRGGRDMEVEAAATALALATILGMGGRRAGDEFVRGADGRLRDAQGRFAAAGQGLGRAAGQAAGGGLSSLRSMLDTLGTGAVNVGTNLWNLIPVLIGIGAGAAVAVPSVHLLGGALGALPALITGIIAVVGVLGMGFGGLSEHFRKTSSAGGSVVDTAHQIAVAERQVRDANREVLASQQALSRAREEAAERIEDLGRSLAGARLDEEEAALAVADAEMELARARATGNPAEIQRADLALRRAKQTLIDVKDRVGDLSKEHEQSSKAGVEGSDEVVSALQRQERAVESLEDAHYALRQAQRPPAGGGAAAELTKLAPAAKEVVDVIKSLRPAWEDLRLDVQQRLFKGVGGEIKSLAGAWLPTLRQRLGGLAGTFNGLFRDLTKNARRPEFIKNISSGLESVDKMIGRVGRSVTGPLVDAWGRLARASGPFVEQLGEEIGDLIDDFSRWISAADDSGDLESFFDKASDFLHDVFGMGRDVASIIGSIFEILFGSPKSVTESPWDAAKNGLDDLRKWFDDPENQEKVQEWFRKIEDVIVWIGEEGIPKVKGWVETADRWINKAEEWGGRIVAFKNGVTGAFDAVVKFFGGLPKRVSRATAGMFDGIKGAYKSAINWVIGRWNGLEFSVPMVNTPFGSFGGWSIGTPDIPYLAKGGNIVRSGLAVVGDAGPELVRLGAGAQVQPLTGAGAAAMKLLDILLRGEFKIRGSDLVILLRRYIADKGGNVQRVLGTS